MARQAARGRDVVLGARGSALSLCQARIVQTRLAARFPERTFIVKPIASTGDCHSEASFAALGEGEGIFVKELQAALRSGEIDLAIHSLKDLPVAEPDGLRIAAVLARDDARDALISHDGRSLSDLPAGSRVGTSSPRRRSQLLRLRKDLQLLEIRGNVDTRLRKLQEGGYDAIVLAACGLTRLGLSDRITEHLGPDRMLPEPGQGALCVEARDHDADAATLGDALNDAATRACVEAERSLLAALGGGCRVPIAAHGTIRDGQLSLDAAVTALDGSTQVRDQERGSLEDPAALGQLLANRLISRGALDLLASQTD